MRVLVIDNYDSFVFNLVQYLGQLGVDCEVRRNDEIDVAEVGRAGAAGVLLSPGPGSPDRAEVSVRRYQLVAKAARRRASTSAASSGARSSASG